MPIAAPTPPDPRAAPAPARLRQAAHDFEAQALGALLQPMFEGLASGGAFGGGAGEAQWRPVLVAEYAKLLAGAGGLGLGEAVLRELARARGA